MEAAERPRGARGARSPQPIVAATIGFGLAYLAMLAGFALAFERPSAAGWGGFGVVVAIVLAITFGIGRILVQSDRMD